MNEEGGEREGEEEWVIENPIFFHLIKKHLDITILIFSMPFQLHLLYHTLSIIPLISFISLWLFFFSQIPIFTTT